MFTAALFTTAKARKQPDCSATHKWIKTTGQIHTMEYHSAVKKNRTVPFAATWMNPEMIIPKEVKDEDKYHMVSLVCRHNH